MIELKIIACNPDDLRRQIASIYEDMARRADAPSTPAPVNLNELIQLTQSRAKEAGFEIEIKSSMPEEVLVAEIENKAAKEARRKSKPVANSSEAASDETDKTSDASDDDLDKLKSVTIPKLQDIYISGGMKFVEGVKKKFGKKLADIPADKFPEIVAEIEAYEGAKNGKSDA